MPPRQADVAGSPGRGLRRDLAGAGKKRALIIGVSGQDGSYLAELLHAHGYGIIGTSRAPRRSGAAAPAGPAMDDLVAWDGLDQGTIDGIVARHQPDECYNLAAYASGSAMYDDPVAVAEINGLAAARILEAIRAGSPRTRFLQASSSEVFGSPIISPQDESSARNPRSPYGAAKLYADSMVNIYRQRYGLFAASAILYNHESPRRGSGFASRKITRAAAAISLGLAGELPLGNLDARRDWGFAGDHVRAMWMVLQAPAAGDYVIATGTSHSVRDICEIAFRHVALDYRDFVREDPAAFRPREPVPLVGNPEKARRELGWEPQVRFQALIEMMVDHDMALLREQIESNGAGNESL